MPRRPQPTRRRVVIRNVTPQVDGGRFTARAVAGRPLPIEADVYADSHDVLSAVVRWRRRGTRNFDEVALEHDGNDRWSTTITPPEPGRYELTIQAWVDHFGTWRRDLRAKHKADAIEPVDWRVGAAILRDLATAAADGDGLEEAAERLSDDALRRAARVELALSDELAVAARRADPRRFAAELRDRLEIRADRPRAQYSTWYELFPRSAAPEPGRHGTLSDVIERLPYVADMGFDVLYLPPIHPIGTSHRKGPDNMTEAQPGDPGSPWAIGSPEGGHKSVHPELGDLEDVDALVAACDDAGLELAMDIAFQCSPDHPYVDAHPEWFRQRPDGSIQYAENPPKKYQDIVPFDFETDDAAGLWAELESVFRFWIDRGVRIFRVDNPHTKSFPFWEWVIDRILADHPDVIFLAEAFTRPRVMEELAKRGFTQSYTYFAWRQRKWELEEYFTELTTHPVVDYFRPNAWPNTPDILTEQLQLGGRAIFVQRLLLAATLCANYGIYGPPFELMLSEARPGAEEYAGNEKYEIRHWDLDRERSLAELIARVNRIRGEHPALQQDRTLTFHHVDNDELIAYSKRAGDDVLLMVVNLDPEWTQSGFTWLDLEELGLEEDARFQVHDLLGDARYLWQGARNYVELDPQVAPGHIFRIRPGHRTERDHDEFM